MVGEISAVTRTEVLRAIRNRYREASKKDKSRMLDEFVAIAGCHRKHAVRLLRRGADCPERSKGTAYLRRGGEGGADRGMGSIGQDMREEAEGGAAQHGGVTGGARSS